MKRKRIVTFAFIAAFAVVIAGYAYSLSLSEKRIDQAGRTYRYLTEEDSASAIEALNEAFARAKETGYGNSELGQIISASSRGATAVGFLRQGRTGESGVYAFFRGCESSALECLSAGTGAEKLDRLSVFAAKIAEAGKEPQHDEGAEERINDILRSPEFETLMHELGMAGFASDSDFQSVGGELTDALNAKKTAEKYLGKNYALRVSESPLAYTVYGSNISAVVSKKGGYLMQLMFDLPEQTPILTEDEAMGTALKFLSENISDADKLVCESFGLDGIYFGEYFPLRDGILCLDEGISVGISAGSGRVCMFDAGDYYRSRSGDVSMPEGCLTAKELGEMWGTENVTPCKIRIAGGVERICYRVENFFADAFDGRRIDLY